MANFLISGFADEIAADLKTQLKVLNEQGINFVEMRNVDGKSILQHDLNSVKEIKKKLDDAGVKLSAIGSYIGKQPIEDEFGHLEDFKHCLETADILETKNIRIFSFFIPRDEHAAYRDEVMERLSKLLTLAKDCNVTLLHENERDIYGDIPERCLEIVEAMDSPHFKLIFDPSNYILEGVTSYPDAWEMTKCNTVYMHIKDAIYAKKEIVPAGCGDGKIKEILQDLNKRNTDIFLSIEPHLSNFAGFSTLENNLKELPAGNNIEKFILAHTALKNIL